MGGYLSMQKKETETMFYILLIHQESIEQGLNISSNNSKEHQLRNALFDLKCAYICSLLFSYQHLKNSHHSFGPVHAFIL